MTGCRDLWKIWIHRRAESDALSRSHILPLLQLDRVVHRQAKERRRVADPSLSSFLG